MWARLCLLGLLICHALEINTYLTTGQRIVLPHLGIVRPMIGVVLCFLGACGHACGRASEQAPAPRCHSTPPPPPLPSRVPGFFVSSHQIFRWIGVLFHMALIVSDFYTVPLFHAEVSCRVTNRCTKRTGFTTAQLTLLENRQYAAIFFEVRQGEGGAWRAGGA
jgi:hypothetical protein